MSLLLVTIATTAGTIRRLFHNPRNNSSAYHAKLREHHIYGKHSCFDPPWGEKGSRVKIRFYRSTITSTRCLPLRLRFTTTKGHAKCTERLRHMVRASSTRNRIGARAPVYDHSRGNGGIRSRQGARRFCIRNFLSQEDTFTGECI